LILHTQAKEYKVVIRTQFNDGRFWPDSVDELIQVVKQTNRIRTVLVGARVGPAHFVGENAAGGGIDCAWLVNTDADLDTYWTVY
jgi:hypothetical protein